MRLRRGWLLLAVLLIAGPAAAGSATRLVASGFALERPEPDAARRGAYDQTALTIFSPRLNFWVDLSDLQPGDHLVLGLRGPDGAVMAARDIPIPLAKDRYFAFAGAYRPSRGWSPGPYTGKVQVTRGDLIVIEQTNQIALP